MCAHTGVKDRKLTRTWTLNKWELLFSLLYTCFPLLFLSSLYTI